MDFPRIVYFDANSIRNLTFGISNVDFLKLKEFCKNTKIILSIPWPAYVEWCYMQYHEVGSEISKINTSMDKINLLLNIKQEKYKEPLNYAEQLMSKVSIYLKQAGINVTHPKIGVSIDKLVFMAAKRERPFQEHDKGFKDMVILLTMISDMQKKGFKKAVYITEDVVFEHEDAKRRFKKERVDITIQKTFAGTHSWLANILKVKVDEFIKRKNEEVLNFLTSHKEEIFKYVIDKAEVSEEFLMGTFLPFKNRDKIFGKVDKVISIKPVGISGVFRGLTVRGKQLSKNKEYVTFSVETEFKLIVSPISLFTKARFPIRSPDEYEKTRDTFPKLYGESEERSVVRKINLEAILEKENGKYSNFEITKILTY